MRIRPLILIATAVWVVAFSEVSAQGIKEPIGEVWRPLPNTQGDGLHAERVRLWRENRLWFISDSGYLLSGHESRPGVHPWQGEHVGKWLHAATLAHEQTRDEKLGKRLEETVERLLATQLPDGYLGTYAEEKRFPSAPDDKGSWDVWSHRYNLYGLLTYERFHPDERIVRACERMGDLLIAAFGEGKADITENGTRLGISSMTLLESMMMLYQRTRRQRFLEFAEHIVECSENAPGLRLMDAMLKKADVSGPGEGKAYQLMANLLGYLLLYKSTGDERYLASVENGWENITTDHLYTTGGPWSRKMSYNANRECFALAKDFSPALGDVETCSTTTWIQLNLHLLELTGQAKYAREAERAVLNALWAAQDGEGGTEWCYYTVANQDHQPFNDRFHCCASSGPRALEMFSHYLIGEVEGGVSLTSLVPSIAVLPDSLGGGEIRVTGDYPRSPRVAIRFKEAPEKELAVEFRDPADSRLTSAEINGKDVAVSKNDRGYYRISRTWKTGDEIAIEFEYMLKSHAVTPEGGQSWVAFTYGPWALAQTIRTGAVLAEPFAEKDVPAGSACEWLEPCNPEKGAGPAFRIKNTEIVLGPYYAAGSKQTGPRTYFKTGRVLPEIPSLGSAVKRKRPEVHRVDLTEALSKFAPGWSVRDCGSPMDPGLRAEWGSRENVLMTHPMSESKPCVLSRSLAIPADGRTTLVLDVAHHSPRHDWVLAVRADGKPLLVGDVSSETSEDLWRSVRVDLSTLAGKTVNLELENRANNWSCEAGYWSQIAVEHGSPEAKQD